MVEDTKGNRYAGLSEKIVMQAITAAGFFMEEDLAKRLIELKIERARNLIADRQSEVDWHTEA